MIDKFDLVYLVQLIKGPTRIATSSSTRIDFIFSSRPERIINKYNILDGLSDHNLLLFIWSYQRKDNFFLPENMTSLGSQKQRRSIRMLLMKTTGIRCYRKLIVKGIFNFLQKHLKKHLKASVQESHSNKIKLCYWINCDILKLMKEKDLALTNIIKSKSHSLRHLFTTLRNKVV